MSRGTRRPSWAFLGLLLLAVAFVVACGVAASRLTLFWDDYEFVLMQVKEPVGSIIMGSNGHAGALSRVALRLTTMSFGLWYPGYAMTNAALAVASVWMLYAALRPRMGSRAWLLPVAAIVYLTSMGLVAQVFIAICLEWFVGMVLAAGAALAISRNRHWGVWGGLLFASWLAMSGTFTAYACIVAVVYLICRWPSGVEAGRDRRRVSVVAGLIVVSGMVGGVIGTTLTLLFPSEYYRVMAERTGAVPLPKDVGGALTTMAYLSGGWLVSPLLVVALTSATLIMTVTIFMAAHVALFWVGLAGLLAVAGLVLWRTARGSSWPEAVQRALPVAMVVPVFEWALMLGITRQGTPFAVRYQMVWLLPTMAFYAMVVAAPVRLRILRIAQVAAAVLVLGSAVVGVVRLPASMQAGADEDKPRWEKSADQRARMLECGPVGTTLPVPVEDISPGLPAADFCTVVDYLQVNSVAGRVFGFRG